MMRSILLTSLAASLLVGCVTRTEFIYPTIDVPASPALPLIARERMECLALDTRRDLAVREELIWGYVEELRTLIEEHNRLRAELE